MTMQYDNCNSIHRESTTVVDAHARGSILTQAASEAGRNPLKQMRTLHVQTAFTDDSDGEMADASAEDGSVEACDLPFSAEVDAAYKVVAASMEKIFSILDVGFGNVLDSYKNLTGFRGSRWLPCYLQIFTTISDRFRTCINQNMTCSVIPRWRKMVHLMWNFMKNARHGHKSCSELKFRL